jgi:hypothetical protein
MPNVRILYLREVIKQKSLFSYLNRIRPDIAPLFAERTNEWFVASFSPRDFDYWINGAFLATLGPPCQREL